MIINCHERIFHLTIVNMLIISEKIYEKFTTCQSTYNIYILNAISQKFYNIFEINFNLCTSRLKFINALVNFVLEGLEYKMIINESIKINISALCSVGRE